MSIHGVELELELEAYRGRRDVGKVGSNTRSVDNIVQSQLVDERAALEEKGQGLCEDGRGRAELATWTLLDRENPGSPGDGEQRHTCPMPPEAPATTNIARSVSVHHGGLLIRFCASMTRALFAQHQLSPPRRWRCGVEGQFSS